ncbi:serine/threonine-protein kinase [Gilvimarinus polysaccharolyticus]|uniref:serine/threonine-protein kinase n=1 Tax=Gilvimarinus polysaccharolyticus TaxID=863921 RepID=UPI00067319DE|nr:serine/threonine-protein kinase [Gilvimarinus polysaccharolyticus]
MTGDNDKTQINNTPSKEPSERRKIGHYEVVSELGRGGMGTVYRAYESSLNRYVAIKVLAPHLADDQELVLRFAREAKSVAALNHPNIVHIYYTGDDNRIPFFVMECVEGDTITDLLAERGVFSPDKAAKMILQAAKGLAAAHQSGIIHRDIKPSNLMVDSTGTLKIADFGIALARDSSDNLTATGHFVGTTGYVSPEIFKGHTVDARSDIFSLGVVLFEMLAGRKPFDDDSPMGQMLQVVEHPAPNIHDLNPAVDAELQKILAKMIAKDPEERYQNCDQLAADIRLYLAGTATSNTVPPVSPASTQTSPSRRRAWLALPLLLLAVGAAGYWWRAPLSEALNGTAPAPKLLPEEAAAAPKAAVVITTKTTEAATTNAVNTAENAAANTPKSTNIADATEPQLTTDQDHTASQSYSAAAAADTPVTATGNNTTAATLAPATVDTTAAETPVATNNTTAQHSHKTTPAVAPTDTVVVVRGDPVLAHELRQMLNQAARNNGLTLLDSAFIAGLGGDTSAPLPALADVRTPIMEAGGRFLVVVNAVTLDSEPLSYYGQQDTLYTGQINLTGYDLVARTQLGTWGEPVRYTNLNAKTQTNTAAQAMVDELSRNLRDAAQ